MRAKEGWGRDLGQQTWGCMESGGEGVGGQKEQGQGSEGVVKKEGKGGAREVRACDGDRSRGSGAGARVTSVWAHHLIVGLSCCAQSGPSQGVVPAARFADRVSCV